MKTISKILSIVLALTMVLGLSVMVSAAAAPETLEVKATEGTLAADSLSIKWTSANFTWTTEKNESTTAIRTSDKDHFRAYQGTKTTIAALNGEKISKVTITTTYKEYVDVIKASAPAGATVSATDLDVEISFAEGVDSVVLGATKQWRVNKVTVVFGAGSAACSHASLKHVDAKGATCSAAGNKEHWICNDCQQYFSDAAAKNATTAADVVVAATGNHSYSGAKCTACGLYKADSKLTIKEAVALGNTFGKNKYTETKHYVSGVITEVINADYGNFTIEDSDGNSILIYGSYSADGKTKYSEMPNKPDEGDTVTVYGVIGKYDAPQMKNVWITEQKAGELNKEEVKIPEADSKLTIKDANTLGKAMGHNKYTEGKYYITGKVSEIQNSQYGNMLIVDGEGNTFLVYGLYSADGETKFDALETQPKVGDTVTVYGVVGQYNGTAQTKNAWMTEHVVVSNPGTGDVVMGTLVALMVLSGTALVVTKKYF